MINKSNQNKTLFLSSSVAKQLGINNLKEQEVYLNNQKTNVFLVNSVADEYYIDEPHNRARRYLKVGGITYDEFAVSKTMISSLSNYEVMVHQKTRDYFIEKNFWTNEGLDAFIGEEYFFSSLTKEEIEKKNTLFNLWIKEREFNTSRVSKEIYSLLKKGRFYSELVFLDKKSRIESNLDIIQILIYLKSLLLKAAETKGIFIDENSFDFSSFNIDELEYLPFSFQKFDYEKRRNFINNSQQLLDDTVDYDFLNYNQIQKQSFEDFMDEDESRSLNKEIKIAELKPYIETKLSLQEIENLEKEFYAAGEINVFDDKDEKEHDQLVDIDHIHDENYNKTFRDLNENEVTSTAKTEKIVDLKVGRLLERKYRRHHETPMMVDIENKVDFLMSGYEALENDDPDVVSRNSYVYTNNDEASVKKHKTRFKKEVQKHQEEFTDFKDLNAIKNRLDEIDETSRLQEVNNFLNENKQKEDIKPEDQKEKDIKTNDYNFEVLNENQNKTQEDIVKTTKKEIKVENNNNTNDLFVENNNNNNNNVSLSDNKEQEIIIENKQTDENEYDISKLFSETNDELDPFNSIYFEGEKYKEIELSDKIKLDSDDFEAKTQEINDKTLELINELSEEKSKKKKKGWSFLKKNKE